MDKPYYTKLWLQMIFTILACSVIPLFDLGAVIYQQFSASYTAKITEDLQTLAENRRGAWTSFLMSG